MSCRQATKLSRKFLTKVPKAENRLWESLSSELQNSNLQMTKMVVKSAFVFTSDISKLYTRRNNSLISFTMIDNNGRMVSDLNLGTRSFSVEHVMRMFISLDHTLQSTCIISENCNILELKKKRIVHPSYACMFMTDLMGSSLAKNQSKAAYMHICSNNAVALTSKLVVWAVNLFFLSFLRLMFPLDKHTLEYPVIKNTQWIKENIT